MRRFKAVPKVVINLPCVFPLFVFMELTMARYFLSCGSPLNLMFSWRRPSLARSLVIDLPLPKLEYLCHNQITVKHHKCENEYSNLHSVKKLVFVLLFQHHLFQRDFCLLVKNDLEEFFPLFLGVDEAGLVREL